MIDLLLLTGALLFFVASGGLVTLCAQLMEQGS